MSVHDTSQRTRDRNYYPSRDRSRSPSSRPYSEPDRQSSRSSTRQDRGSEKKKPKFRFTQDNSIELPIELFGYTNNNNPFNDNQLSRVFIWKKKLKKMYKHGDPLPTFNSKWFYDKLMHNKQEITLAQQRRRIRQLEKDQREMAQEQIARDVEMEASQDFEIQQGQFLLLQQFKKCQLRFTNGNEIPLDSFLRYLLYRTKIQSPALLEQLGESVGESSYEQQQRKLFFDSIDGDLPSLVDLVDMLTIQELQQLLADARTMLDLTRKCILWNHRQRQQEELQMRLRAQNATSMNTAPIDVGVTVDQGITAIVDDGDGEFWHHSINIIQQQYNIQRLAELNINTAERGQQQNQQHSHQSSLTHPSMLNRDATSGNVKSAADRRLEENEIKQSMLPEYDVLQSRTKLQSFHRRLSLVHLLQQHQLQQLYKAQHQHRVAKGYSNRSEGTTTTRGDMTDTNAAGAGDSADPSHILPKAEAGGEDSIPNALYADPTKLEPSISSSTSIGADMQMKASNDDIFNDIFAIQESLSSGAVADPSGGDDLTNVQLGRFQSRRPRYIAKVITGFGWSQYNRVHYDPSNPPPKAVQGYQFTIFYNDLIDPKVAPTFTVSPDPDNPDYDVLRFAAGPPYEDIAFKIIRKEWNTASHTGYRSEYIGGKLILTFRFKHVRYRR